MAIPTAPTDSHEHASEGPTDPRGLKPDIGTPERYEQFLLEYLATRPHMNLSKPHEVVAARYGAPAAYMSRELQRKGCPPSQALYLSCLVLFDLAILIGMLPQISIPNSEENS